MKQKSLRLMKFLKTGITQIGFWRLKKTMLKKLILDLMDKNRLQSFENIMSGRERNLLQQNTIWLLDKGEITPQSKIFRIMPIRRLEEIFSSGMIGLSGTQGWDDPFENFFLRSDVLDECGKSIGLDLIAQKWYGQCWTLTEETDALWRIYSPDLDGVRVQTTIEKLFSAFYDDDDEYAKISHFMSRVIYRKRADIEEFLENTPLSEVIFGGQNIGFAGLLSIKREEFSHENEVRILKYKESSGKFILLPINPNCLFDSITFDPRIRDPLLNFLKIKLSGLGCTVPFLDSELYKVTPVLRHL